jgi:peptidoglycan/LPS O-acetylase OafA/YrhL
MNQLLPMIAVNQDYPIQKKEGFIESVHLLRGLAAVLVLIDHTFGWIDLGRFSALIQPIDGHGRAGVVIFFIISGFILPYSMKPGYKIKHYITFILKRLVRLDPVYISALIFSAALLYAKTRIASGGEPWTPTVGQVLAHLMYLIPFTDYSWINEVFWTLGIEFQFYILLGFFFPLIIKNLETRNSYWLCCICLGLSLMSVKFGAELAKWGFTIVPYASLFLLGILAFGYHIKKLNKVKFYVTGSLLLFLYMVNPIGDFYESAIAALTMLIILFWSAPKLKIRFLGTISYSLYVVHYPITAFINGNVANKLIESGSVWASFPWIFPLASLVFSFAAAYLLYALIEVPTIRLSRSIKYAH